MNSKTVEDYAHRPKEYYNIDGVGELGMGFMLLAFALLIWLQTSAPKGSVWPLWYMLVFLLVVPATVHYGSKAIKKHITYPRTGFVSYPRRTYLSALVTALIVAPICLVLVLRGRVNYATLMGLAVVPAYAYHMARTVQWKWLVVLALAAGSLAISAAPPEFVRAAVHASRADFQWLRGGYRIDSNELAGSALLTMSFYGSVLLVSGAISFYLYLRHTQPPAPKAE
jgi:hypothetical protein